MFTPTVFIYGKLTNKIMEKERVFWLVGSKKNKPYTETTWLRLLRGEDFVRTVEERHKIVGIVFSENNIGFILDEKNENNC